MLKDIIFILVLTNTAKLNSAARSRHYRGSWNILMSIKNSGLGKGLREKQLRTLNITRGPL